MMYSTPPGHTGHGRENLYVFGAAVARIMYSIPPGHVGQVFDVVVQGSFVGVATTTHFHPSSHTSHDSCVGQTSHSIGVAAQSIHSITVTVFGFGQILF